MTASTSSPPEGPGSAAWSPAPAAGRTFHRAGASLNRYECDGCTVVEASGEIDIDVAPLLREVLAGAASSRVVVELTDVSLVDSTGLAVLVETWRDAQANGGWLRLAHPNDAVLKVLRITQLDQLLAIHDNLDEAMELVDRDHRRWHDERAGT